ncbi:hypothetical protein Scep_024414 [Stephania cephalantha]|uniref:Uncharacterized protein n=1 Tax=Stephania cephalantha TaxID=152367 RepID=A0AAP0EX52_9MAGN
MRREKMRIQKSVLREKKKELERVKKRRQERDNQRGLKRDKKRGLESENQRFLKRGQETQNQRNLLGENKRGMEKEKMRERGRKMRETMKLRKKGHVSRKVLSPVGLVCGLGDSQIFHSDNASRMLQLLQTHITQYNEDRATVAPAVQVDMEANSINRQETTPVDPPVAPIAPAALVMAAPIAPTVLSQVGLVYGHGDRQIFYSVREWNVDTAMAIVGVLRDVDVVQKWKALSASETTMTSAEKMADDVLRHLTGKGSSTSGGFKERSQSGSDIFGDDSRPFKCKRRNTDQHSKKRMKGNK